MRILNKSIVLLRSILHNLVGGRTSCPKFEAFECETMSARADFVYGQSYALPSPSPAFHCTNFIADSHETQHA